MLVTLMNLLSSCWLPSDRYGYLGSDAVGRQDGLLWYKDSGVHFNGEFSMAVVQANNLLEDQCQIESGPLSLLESGPYGTFVGVYDGHGGPETSRYINDHLFQHLKRFAAEHQSISVDVIRKAYQATEEGFTSLVAKQWSTKPQLAAVGSCCLVGVVTGGMLYTANLGDSRVVLGKLVKATGEVLAVQLSAEHNVGIDSARQELQSMHPEDKQIVVLKHNVWRVKGLIQVSRSIGDVYLKKAEFNREPLIAKFRLRETFKKPILSSEPYISVQPLQPQDLFLIFASDGLWEHLSNQEAADIVHNNPHSGSARRLIKAALQEAAKKREMRYSDLQKIDRGIRRHFHDDITVVAEMRYSGASASGSSEIGLIAEQFGSRGFLEPLASAGGVDESEVEERLEFDLSTSRCFKKPQGIINVTSTYNSRTNGIESSLVARGDLWRVEASRNGSASRNDTSPPFLIQLGPLLFVRDTTVLLPVHLSKQHLLWYGYDRKNGLHSLCPALWSKHRRWLMMSMICLYPFTCTFMDLQFPNGQLTYVAGEGLTTSAFLPVLGGLLQAQSQYPGDTRLSFSCKYKTGTCITPMVQWPDKSFSLGFEQDLAWKRSGLILRPTIQFSVCPTFGGNNPGLLTELTHSLEERLNLSCGYSLTRQPSAFASVALGRSKWNGNAGNAGVVIRAEIPLSSVGRSSFSVQLNSGIEF